MFWAHWCHMTTGCFPGSIGIIIRSSCGGPNQQEGLITTKSTWSDPAGATTAYVTCTPVTSCECSSSHQQPLELLSAERPQSFCSQLYLEVLRRTKADVESATSCFGCELHEIKEVNYG